MKNTIFEYKKAAYIGIFSIFLANLSFGQQTDKDIPLQVFHYQIDNEKFFVIEGHVQGSQLSFYDKQGGGKLIKTAITMEDNGKYKLQTDEGFNPSFVLNNQNSRSCDVAGSGMVAHLTTKEFLLKNLSISRKSNSYNELSWQASVQNIDAYYFVLESTTDDIHYTPLMRIFPYSESTSKYIYSDITNNTDTKYRVSVFKKDIGLRYTTTLSTNDYSNDLTIYPTIVNSEINIKGATNTVYSYEIQTIEGRTIKNGEFNNQTSINLQSLSNGTYHLIILNKNIPIQQSKFTKI